jgi:hypothetical protein
MLVTTYKNGLATPTTLKTTFHKTKIVIRSKEMGLQYLENLQVDWRIILKCIFEK